MPDTPSPSTSVTPLQGKTTIDDKMFFDPERLSYESAVEIATTIAAEIEDSVRNKIVVIAGIRLLADFANLQAVYVLLDCLRRDYDGVAEQARSLVKRTSQPEEHLESFVSGAAAVAAATISSPTTATAVVGAALGLISMFRQDVEYHGEKTLVDALAFEIALAAEVRHRGAQSVYVPDLVVLTAPKHDESTLQRNLNKVQEAKSAAWASVAPLVSELVRVEADLDKAAKKKDQVALDSLSVEVSAIRRDLAPVVDPLGRLDERLADLQNQLNQTEPSSGLIALARLLRAEALQLSDPVYLHASVVSSGGYYRISRNLFRTLFMGDGLSFAGGATVRWALLNKDGSVARGGIRVVGLKGKYGQGSQDEADRRQSVLRNGSPPRQRVAKSVPSNTTQSDSH